MNFCNLGVNRHRKLVNIGEEEESDMSSGVNFNAWVGGGGSCALQNIPTRMHACIHIYTYIQRGQLQCLERRVHYKTYIHTCMHKYIYIYTSGCISKIKAIMNGRPFIRNQIYHLSKSSL